MNIPLHDAQEVADYFLALVDGESGDDLTNLKLQKLLYYAQGIHLALRGEPLFPQDVEAWDHGPVVPSVYHRYKGHQGRPIEASVGVDRDDFAPETCELLDTVWAVYGQYAPWKLRDMTHAEPPWSETPPRHVISLQSLRAFFRGVVEAGRAGDAKPGEPLWPTDAMRHQRRREIMKSATNRDRNRIRAILDRIPSPDPWADDEA